MLRITTYYTTLPGFKQCGALMVARNRDRLTALHHQHSFSKIVGVEAHLLNPQECLDKCPLLNVDDVLASLWIPEEGTLSPSDLCQAYVKGAQALGAVLLEGTPVVGLRTEGRRVVSVTTPKGDIQCETFVNCAGQWARHLAQVPCHNLYVHTYSCVCVTCGLTFCCVRNRAKP